MSEELATLSYGTESRPRWGRVSLLTAAGLLVLIASAVVGPKLQMWYRGTLMVHRAMAVCLRFSQPLGQVDYEEDPTRSVAQPANAGSTTTKEGTIVGFTVNPPDALLPVLFSNSGLRLGGTSTNLVFLHSVRSPSGHDRLVYVAVSDFFALRQGNGALPGDWRNDMLECLVIDPGSWRTPPRLLTRNSWRDAECWSGMPFPIRLQAGQPDATDPSRFVINCQTPAGTTAIVCKLDANDQLTFTRTQSTTKP